MVQHDQLGYHTNITASNISSSAVITACSIDFNPSGAASSMFRDSSDNELVKFTQTASAVNEFSVANAATGNAPLLSATGGDTNIHADVRGKGTGLTRVSIQSDANGTPTQGATGIFIRGWARITGVTAGSVDLALTYGVTLAAYAFPVISCAGNDTAGTETPATNAIGDAKVIAYAKNSSTTGFTATISHGDGTNISNSIYYVVNYFVLGVM